MIEELIHSAHTEFDLTERSHQESLLKLADAFVAAPQSVSEILAETASEEAPLEARIAALLADSRSWLLDYQGEPIRVAVVFAMWGEQNRLRPKSSENPTGEDSLAIKLEQLEWATKGTCVEWHLHAVDDGCPHGSGDLARRIAEEHPLREKVSVHKLEEVLPAVDGPLQNLKSADDSRKAGAVILGCISALEQGVDAVVYTDADNSVPLGQIGLLLRPMVEQSSPVVLGDRKRAGSVLVKEAARWGIGIKVLRHMQRMIGKEIFSRGILDTQAAFKLYESTLLREIIAEPTVYDFSFDTDWILAAIRRKVKITQIPFAFVDSAAESASITQGPMTTWETLLFGLAKAVKRHGFCESESAEMVSVLEEEIEDYRDLERIIDRLPPELEFAGENDFGDPEVMSPEQLRSWLRGIMQSES